MDRSTAVMIGEPPLLKLRREFSRPTPAAIEPLRESPTGTGLLVDCMDGRGALGYRIKPLDNERPAFVGFAITCQAAPGDCLAVLAAIEMAQAGDVIVAATGGFTGTCVAGSLMLGMARNRGVVAFVTDGLVRDVESVLSVGIPTFCQGVSPNTCFRNGPGTVGLRITIGGVSVDAGDILLGDRDGVVVIPQNDLTQVCERLPDVRAAEESFEREVRKGLDHSVFIRELLDGDRVKNV